HRDRAGADAPRPHGRGPVRAHVHLYAHLLNASSWVTPDGTTRAARQELDKWQLGWNALYRLYETAAGWLCLAVLTDEHWQAFRKVIGRDDLHAEPQLAPGRLANDAALAGALEPLFRERTAPEWFELLDGAGVPCEVVNKDFSLGLFDDPEMVAKGWVAHYDHPYVGREDALGLLWDFSETPGIVQGPPLVPGEHTRDIMSELGYDASQIDEMVTKGVVGEMVDPATV